MKIPIFARTMPEGAVSGRVQRVFEGVVLTTKSDGLATIHPEREILPAQIRPARTLSMAIFREFVPEVGQEVLIRNHLGTFRITGIDPSARSVNVTIRAGETEDGIPWANRVRILKATSENCVKGVMESYYALCDD